jgi:hypothetical protein
VYLVSLFFGEIFYTVGSIETTAKTKYLPGLPQPLRRRGFALRCPKRNKIYY